MISKCRCPTARFVSPSFEHFELLYLVGFRWMLDALDVNARGSPRDSHRLLVVKNGPVVARSRVAQREVLGDQVRARAKGANECADDCCEKLEQPASLLKAGVFVSGDSWRETR